MDADIARWILEFLLRQAIEDRVINNIINVLPISNVDHRLMKTILLRRISSEIHKGSISETILDSLEIIEELDHREGITILNSMKEAYCDVAVDCTVKFLRENSDDCREYFDAVVRIWKGRIVDMERCGTVGLVSDRLKNSRDEVEAALWNANLRQKILMKDTRNDALKSVTNFLAEAEEEMGPSFLEFAKKTMNEYGKELQVSSEASMADQAGKRRTCLSNFPSEALLVNDGNNLEDNGNYTDVDSSTEIRNVAKTKCNPVPTPEFRKVQEALKSSSLDLQAVVKDPLPDALRMATTIASNMEREEINHEQSVEDGNRADMDACDRSAEAVQVKEVLTGNQNAFLKPSLMIRNNTAHTFEWGDDSIESSHKGSPSRPNLPTPKNRAVSPLRKQEIGRICRRKKMKWSSLEENTLRDAVKEYGKGNWKLILDNYTEIFEGRTVVDLKDKWRNMTRY